LRAVRARLRAGHRGHAPPHPVDREDRRRDRLAAAARSRANPRRHRRLRTGARAARVRRLLAMCGICGIASTDDAGAQRELVERMSARLRHRGPDSDGLHAEPGVVLAARRLAIIDLEGGDQPIANEDGTIRVVQNGEIYNYPELREQALQAGHALRTRCDTEIHVHLYEEQGPRYVERLRGMFAVALWDARARRLVLARDRFGIKPLYYSVAGGTLAFASELKALLELPDVSRKLGQGELLLWDEGSPVPTVERYARPLPEPPRSESDEELAEELRRLLRDAVRAHLLSDVPVGVLLSGGVDSSGLTALASELADEAV